MITSQYHKNTIGILECTIFFLKIEIWTLMIGIVFFTPGSWDHHHKEFSIKENTGWEERGKEHEKYLCSSVMVIHKGRGSGTIVHYDKESKYAYILTCGHVVNEIKERHDSRWVVIKRKRYKSDKYYEMTKKGDPGILVQECEYVLDDYYDVGIIKIYLDYEPECTPIAKSHNFINGEVLHSIGCDSGTDPAHYLVQYKFSYNQNALCHYCEGTKEARCGRSGGALINENKELVGIIIRKAEGTNYTVYASLNQIHKFLKEENMEFILN